MYGLAGAVFAIDRLTKWIIETRVGAIDTHVIIPDFFEIVHSQNRGAAFGLFAESTSEWRTVLLIGFSAVALVALIVMLWRTPRLDRMTATALALILGGAMGNVFDRCGGAPSPISCCSTLARTSGRRSTPPTVP